VYVQTRQEYDAIVVGSGVAGGWAAKELTEKGLSTVVLERGRSVEHGTDYVTENQAPWELYFRGRGDREEFERDYPIQRKGGGFGEATSHFYVNDRENPYTYPEDHPFMWIRGHQVGGRSLIWGRQCYRWSDLDFEANARDGFGVDWPIRYADIASWYDYVERFAGISGQAEGLPQLPDGQFQPPMAMNCGERFFKERMEASFPGRRMTVGRVANLTRALNGRSACQYRNQCSRGCSYGAYFSSQSATLPAAQSTGLLTLRPNSIVHSILYDAENDRASGVRVIDAETGAETEVYGRLLFLCASALGTTRIMLNSISTRFPNGIANSSGALGHYLMDHCFQAGASGELQADEDAYFYGRRPNGIYVARFRNLGNRATEHPDFLRGYGFQGSASRAGWGRGAGLPGLGSGLKENLRRPGPWSMWIGGWGECLPREENYVELDPDVTDAWDMPVLRIRCAWSDNEDRMREDMALSAAEMLEAAGARNIEPFIEVSPPGLCIHEMGTARMGRDPSTSVLNANNQAHDVSNLFVTDGACMTSSACQNPSITYMALTARACEYAVDEINRGNL
jgi:choline dehydrogenase-like flavoprotein